MQQVYIALMLIKMKQTGSLTLSFKNNLDPFQQSLSLAIILHPTTELQTIMGHPAKKDIPVEILIITWCIIQYKIAHLELICIYYVAFIPEQANSISCK